MIAPNNTPEAPEPKTPPDQIRHVEPTAPPPKPVRPAHPPRRTASWGAAPKMGEAWSTESMDASLSASLSRCATASSAFQPVTPTPPDKPTRLVPRVTPDDAVRKNLKLDEDLAWATA